MKCGYSHTTHYRSTKRKTAVFRWPQIIPLLQSYHNIPNILLFESQNLLFANFSLISNWCSPLQPSLHNPTCILPCNSQSSHFFVLKIRLVFFKYVRNHRKTRRYGQQGRYRAERNLQIFIKHRVFDKIRNSLKNLGIMPFWDIDSLNSFRLKHNA